MSGVIESETRGRLRVLRLNRPDRKNALNEELAWGVIHAVRDAAADDEVWAIAITGNGDAFCSGLDLEGFGGSDDGPPNDGRSEQERRRDDYGWVGHMALATRVECDKPVLAGVNGVAVGAGLSLAMCADMRIASPTARFHPGYARVGTSPDGGLSWTLTQALGYERCLRFLLELRMIDAVEARIIGLVGEVTGDDDFEDRFLEYGAMLASIAPIAAQQTKRLVMRALVATDLAAHLRDEMRWALRGLDSDDAREAMRAMAAREQPTFRGL
ncbi:MAG TPA: enoyl-CoA hydratase/isomerase family protein [Microthrixaceae bacterium]|nr:enoyl-CoA hydratase/isomerase family protein [Microthrixaceae bacterium]